MKLSLILVSALLGLSAAQSTTLRTSTKTTKISSTKTTTKMSTTKVTTTKSTSAKTTKTTTAGASAHLAKIPASAGVTAYPTARVISGVFDAGMLRYERNPPVCLGQLETNETLASFILEPGAHIKNAIIGASQAEGIHCRGTCTIENVWWVDVCEDAATFRQTSGTSYVKGGGAFFASDKIFQFNGRGTINIDGFYAYDFGKISRSCGDCPGNGGPRNIIINNVKGYHGAKGGVLCGINSNYGDTCRITDSCQTKGKSCDIYEGVQEGQGESKKLTEGPDNISCFATNFSATCPAV